MRNAIILVLLLAVVSPLCAGETARARIDSDFPGGNIIVDKQEGDDVYLHQDLRDTKGDWFYWHFRVSGAQRQKLTFHFTRGNPIGVRGPAVSLDEGKTWKWLGAASVRASSFHYAFPVDAKEVRFCFAFAYQDRHLQEFLKRFEKSPHFRVESLGKTKKGRNVDILFLGRLDGECRHRVALTCRHHSCEMMASYVLEGFMEAILADNETGKWLQENVEFAIVPMVDKDGVEDGDQGKNRKPRDHNRDYEGESIYPEVSALRERLTEWSAGKLRFALDLHCPYIRGTNNEWIYFVGGPDEKIWKEVERYCEMLESVQSGPLVFNRKNNLAFGQAWNTKANYTTGKPFARWAAELPGVQAASTLEVPYANAGGREVTDGSARALGHDLAKGLLRYLNAMK